MIEIPIQPIEIDGVKCKNARVSLAVGTGLALRAVPFDLEGTEYPDYPITIVGNADDPFIAAFVAQLENAVANLVSTRGA
jgi:hypothetical protein